ATLLRDVDHERPPLRPEGSVADDKKGLVEWRDRVALLGRLACAPTFGRTMWGGQARAHALQGSRSRPMNLAPVSLSMRLLSSRPPLPLSRPSIVIDCARQAVCPGPARR